MEDACLSFAQLSERLFAGGDRLPIRMGAELTYRCNFGCVQCYCRLPETSPRAAVELDGSEWERILAEAAEEGTLFLTLTGGEPLLHRDFRQIWVAAKRLGLLSSVFTNGSLVDEETADFLAEWPPVVVSVTLYGATDATYRAVTGRSGMLDRVLAGLELLRERGVRIETKATFTRLNASEFDELRSLCNRLATFRWGAEMVGPSAEGGGEPLAVGLGAAEIIALEKRDPRRWGGWEGLRDRFDPEPGPWRGSFRCAIGRNELFVDPYGSMRACMLLPGDGYDLKTGSVRAGWREALPRSLEVFDAPPGPCQQCSLSAICRICPALALRLGSEAVGPTPFHCSLGRERAAALGLPAFPASDRREGANA